MSARGQMDQGKCPYINGKKNNSRNNNNNNETNSGSNDT